MQEQRRGRRIAMSPDELDTFLREERTCRVATVGKDGRPHNSPLWFAWDGAALWLNSIVKSQRWTDIGRDPRASIIVDAGHAFGELRGAELIGALEPVGEAPRTSGPDPTLETAERLYAEKYSGTSTFQPDGRHAWLRLTPDKVVSWDFRKMGG
jgi:PPOX class probable F420-dependent enzyme